MSRLTEKLEFHSTEHTIYFPTRTQNQPNKVNYPDNIKMGFFEGSFKMTKVSPAIKGLTREAAIAKLQDKDFFIKCDPHLVSYDANPDPAWGSYDAPKHLKPLAQRVKSYTVKDKYENPIIGSDIESTYEFIDLADGFFVRVRSPMGTTMESTFVLRDKGNGDLEVVQECDCKCNKALSSMVKKDLDKNYIIIHENLAQRIGGN
ncbi:uncharacterized protein PG986_004090 [Apiospora aurea]|uniref:DUF7053 domain-containing protein n=1 Tax=Apiospora aurea TaxID=335848 RepID=A0ABR1QLL4_9PEZI